MDNKLMQQLEEMSESDSFMLVTAALMGQLPNVELYDKMAKKCGITANFYMQARALVNKNLLRDASRSLTAPVFKPFPLDSEKIMAFAELHHQDWKTVIEKGKTVQNKNRVEEVLTQYISGFLKIPLYKMEERIVKKITKMLSTPTILSYLDSDAYESDLLRGLTRYCIFSLPWEEWDNVVKILDAFIKINVEHTAYLREMLRPYYFLATGNVLKPKESAENTRQSNFLLTSFSELLEHNSTAAAEHFKSVLSIQNLKNGRKSYCFEHPLLNYLYIMALWQSKLDENMMVLKQMRKMQSPFCNGLTSTMEAFVDYIIDDDTAQFWKNSRADSCTPLTVAIDCVLRNYMSDEPSEVVDNVPYRFLESELANNPKKIVFSIGSVIARVKRATSWQLAIDNIIKENTEDVDSADKRIIYILNKEDKTFKIRQQAKLKSGKWSSGRDLSISRFAKSECSCMDSTDKMVQHFASAISIDSKCLSGLVYFSLLVDCDRVFDNSPEEYPVTIVRKLPYIQIKKTSKEFEITSNIMQYYDDIANQVELIVNEEPFMPNNYTVVSLSKTESYIYSQLLKFQTMPLTAEPMLTKMQKLINEKIKFISDLEVEDTIKEQMGNTTINLRFVQHNENAFSVTAVVYPYSGSKECFFPGRGQLFLFVNNENDFLQIERSLQDERIKLQRVRDALIELGICDLDDDFDDDGLQMTLDQVLKTLDWARENPNVCSVEWTEGNRIKVRSKLEFKSFRLALKNANGWLEMEGEVQLDSNTVLSIAQFVELMQKNTENSFVKLADGDFVRISKALEKQLHKLSTVMNIENGHLIMPKAALPLVSDVVDGELDVKQSETIEALKHQIEESHSTVIAVPKDLQATLRDYQYDGYQWMMRMTQWGAGVCLADDMGLGKTLQTIAVLLACKNDGPALVVAPTSVMFNWNNELTHFAPSLHVKLLNEATNREAFFESVEVGDIVLCTYGVLVREEEAFAKLKWNVVCLDEAHAIKNRDTKMSQAAMMLNAQRRIILTGTPVQNHLSELWNLYQFINPGLLGGFEKFTKKFIIPIETEQKRDKQERLRRIISPFLLRRTKKEVMEELPEKSEIQISVELSEREMAAYEVYRQKVKQEIDGQESVNVTTLAKITHLRQMACSTQLVDKKWNMTSSKTQALLDLVDEIDATNSRALIFSQFTSYLGLVKKAFDEKQIQYIQLDGTTPPRKREQMVKDFQDGKISFFLISLKAGGLGLNLTEANYVIHLDPWWNPAIEQQATDRAYRMGQQRNVTVYHLIAQHTIEEKILRLHATKRNLADSLLEGSDVSHKLTREELLQLLEE